MTNPRKEHVGKNQAEKDLYRRVLRTQQAEAPTFEADEMVATNSYVVDQAGKSSITEPQLRPYDPQKRGPNGELIWQIILSVIIFVIFLFGMNLNREVGVLDERDTALGNNQSRIEDKVDRLNDSIYDLRVDLEVIRATEF